MSRIFVLGNAGMDVTLELPRLPIVGETMVAGAVSRAPGGKGLNQAVVAARAGATVRFAASIGDDGDAVEIAAVLAREPFERLDLKRMSQRSDQSILMVATGGDNFIVTAGACADALDPETAEAFVADMASGDLLLLQGNLSLPSTLAAAEAARARGARIMLNAAPLRWPVTTLLPLCDVVVVNEAEADGITGRAGEAAARRLRDLGARCAIVTLGAAGCVVAEAEEIRHFAGTAVRAVDSTGAGDTFCGVLASSLVALLPLPESLDSAQRAAAVAVQRPGAYAALPTREELRGIR